MSRVTLHVAESESGPGALSSDLPSVHGPTLLVTSVAAASSRLGFCPVHPRSAQTCPVPLRRALTAAESVSSSARWGRGAREPWSLPAPLFPGPLDLPILETQTWRWKPLYLPHDHASSTESWLCRRQRHGVRAGPQHTLSSGVLTLTSGAPRR